MTSEVKGMSFEDMDKELGMTDEIKKKIGALNINPKLVMPTPGDHKTDKIIRFKYSRDNNNKLVPIKVVKSDSPNVKNPDGLMKFFTVEEYDNQGIDYDMNFGTTIFRELIKFAEQNNLKREEAFGKWFKLYAEKYNHKEHGETISYKLKYMEDLNKKNAPTAAAKASQDDF